MEVVVVFVLFLPRVGVGRGWNSTLRVLGRTKVLSVHSMKLEGGQDSKISPPQKKMEKRKLTHSLS